VSLRADVAGDLAELILTGQLRPGDTLPSEGEIAEERGISRTTVRAAYADLEARGLVVSRAGARRLVASRTLLTINVTRPANRVAGTQRETRGADSWVHDVETLGLQAGEKLSVQEGVAGDLAGRLQIGEQEKVITRELARSVDGVPHNVATWVFPRWYAASTKLTLPGSIEGGSIPYLNGIGYGADSFEVEVETRMPDRDEQALLQMPSGIPVLITYRTGMHLSVPVFVEVTRWRGDQTRLRMES